MTLTNYEKGRAHEYAIKRKWEKMGWIVLRTAGSHGEFDLIAIRFHNNYFEEGGALPLFCMFPHPAKGEVVFIQAKSGKSAKRERGKLVPLKTKYEGIYSVRVELL